MPLPDNFVAGVKIDSHIGARTVDHYRRRRLAQPLPPIRSPHALCAYRLRNAEIEKWMLVANCERHQVIIDELRRRIGEN